MIVCKEAFAFYVTACSQFFALCFQAVIFAFRVSSFIQQCPEQYRDSRHCGQLGVQQVSALFGSFFVYLGFSSCSCVISLFYMLLSGVFPLQFIWLLLLFPC